MSLWDVKDDATRGQWTWVPVLNVGPLHFGTTHDQVCTTLGGERPHPQTCKYYRQWSRAEFRQGVTVYYTDGLLGIVAIHARYGPQVTYNHQTLVGRPPSEIGKWTIDQHLAHGYELRYSTFADPELFELGLVVRVQRAGDIMLTRPVMLSQPADVSWDVVPSEEWDQWW